ncbi:MAG TPA: hypothetical protein PLN21_09945 [Gemmatales bacterium]|nr:hypothetical protein [Gemmatales bacterium]
MLRRLIRSPIHVENDYFLQATSELWGIAKDTTNDPRCRVQAVKAITDICKTNLQVSESQKQQAAAQHLHIHQRIDYSKISTEDLERIHAELIALAGNK